jgi:hypothetical protein
LYFSPNIIRITESWMRWEWNVACMGEKRNAQRFLLGKHERKRQLGSPSKMDLMDRIGLYRLDSSGLG